VPALDFSAPKAANTGLGGGLFGGGGQTAVTTAPSAGGLGGMGAGQGGGLFGGQGSSSLFGGGQPKPANTGLGGGGGLFGGNAATQGGLGTFGAPPGQGLLNN